MATPITVGATPIIAILRNRRRYSVKFQNTGDTTLYFLRAPGIPSSSNYEFLLKPAEKTPGNSQGNEKEVDMNQAIEETRSTAQFNVVSSKSGGILAIYETKTL